MGKEVKVDNIWIKGVERAVIIVAVISTIYMLIVEVSRLVG